MSPSQLVAEAAVEAEAEEVETTTELFRTETANKHLKRLKRTSHLYEQYEIFSVYTKRGQ